jgi:APA family basic amino acid/polyamine antiporter
MASGQPNASQKIFSREATGLTKQLSGWDALGVILSGIGLLFVFNAIGLTDGVYPGANPIVTPIFGFLLVLPLVAMYVLFTIALPRTGGDYVWVGRTFHPIVGFFTNFTITIISISFVGSIGTAVVSWALSEELYDMGKIYNNASWISMATSIQSVQNMFILSVVFIILAAGMVAASTKLSAGFMRYWTYASWVIGAIFVITVVASGVSGFTSNFNHLSGANYTGVIAAGQKAGAPAGIPSPFNSTTLYAGALGLLGYLAFNYSAYFSSEVKRNNRSQIFAQFGGVTIFMLFSVIMIAVMYLGQGPSFANSMALLWGLSSAGVVPPSSYPYINLPMGSGLSMFWNPNPILVSLFNISFIVASFALGVSILFTLSRNIFAWSFDRVIPNALADVSPKTGTPLKAILLMSVVGLFYAYVTNYQFGMLAEIFSYGTAGIFTAFLIVSLAAIFFPFRRKDLFSNAPPPANARVGGLPLLTLVGILSLICSSIVVYAILEPAVLKLSTVLVYGIIPTFIVGAVIYAIAHAIRRSQGINLNLLQKEIPPE